MSATELTAEEMFESLTGFEEVAISSQFGHEIGYLASERPTMFLRALVAAHLAREGKNAKDAKAEAMGMSIKTCSDYFADDDEPNPEEPVTESGKGEGLPD